MPSCTFSHGQAHFCFYWSHVNRKPVYAIWAPSSEFVSSSILSWQILTAHAQPFKVARDLAFCLKVPLDSLLVWASSEGSGETARMRRLAWTFAAIIGDKYQIRLTRSICEQQRRRSACLDNRLPLVYISEISSNYLASVAEQAILSLTGSKTLKTGFLVTRLICDIVCWWTLHICTCSFISENLTHSFPISPLQN